jgi:hypothetical protein
MAQWGLLETWKWVKLQRITGAPHCANVVWPDLVNWGGVSFRATPKGYVHEFVNHTQKEYARGDVHENRAECLFSLLKPYLRVFRGLSKTGSSTPNRGAVKL